MKFQLDLGGKKLLLTPTQLDALMELVGGCEANEEVHIGNGKGTHGYNNNYATHFSPLPTSGWLTPTVIEDHYYDTIKLMQKCKAES